MSSNDPAAPYTTAGAVALVTGANRGIGAAFVQELFGAGGEKVYAAARNPATVVVPENEDRVVPVQLDVTDDASVDALAQQLTDVTLLVNNAGAGAGEALIGSPDMSGVRVAMETNFFGMLRMCRAFAPTLAANGGGAIINVLSTLARVASPVAGGYSASKAAGYSLTQSVRGELLNREQKVVGVFPGFVDTDMTKGLQVPKTAPRDVARAAFNALQTGEEDVYPGEAASQTAAMLLTDPKAVERRFAGLMFQ